MDGLENNINQAMRDVMIASLDNLEYNEKIVFSLNIPENEHVKKYIFKEEKKQKLVNDLEYQPMFLYGVDNLYKDLTNKSLLKIKEEPENKKFGAKYDVNDNDNILIAEILCALDFFVEDYVNKKLDNNKIDMTQDGKKIIELDDLRDSFVNYLVSNNLVKVKNIESIVKIDKIVDANIKEEIAINAKKIKI